VEDLREEVVGEEEAVEGEAGEVEEEAVEGEAEVVQMYRRLSIVRDILLWI